MAFDKTTRNRLASFVGDARRLIADEFTQKFQSIYGISDKGEITPVDQLGHLDDSGLATAALLRDRIEYLVNTHPDDKDGTKAAVERLAREQAFTILNRLAAIRMAEKRGLIVESVGKGYQSKGFKVFEQVAGSGLGDIYHRYRRYLFCLFDELAVDLGSLFDRQSPQSLLFPREPALLALIELINASDIDSLWTEDETIGWIYQYYNDPAERKKMRDESAAPRNSRELAVRNQFFTPRYVVEFLTDNTLGRIWYEMTQGQTSMKDTCRYLVSRPTEIFLKPNEVTPVQTLADDSLPQEELLKQPVYIPNRPLKDPRTLRMLDPACGSMHFGLYAFDLYERIYEESWELELMLGHGVFLRESSMKPLIETYSDKAAFQRDVPRLIIEHNIHGIDIDPRAAQIAGLSLWLRAQRSWHSRNVKPAERPHITRSNIVCAEPMPGDKEMLREFTVSLEVPALGYLLEQVFDKMQLAGEAGSLLKIEEEIHDIVTEAKRLWKSEPKLTQMGLFGESSVTLEQKELPLDFTGITDERFWEGAEDKLYQALQEYSEQAGVQSYQKRLFAEDAANGFAFIDLCRKRYDVSLMNPPFGEPTVGINNYLTAQYPLTKNNLYCAFVERQFDLCTTGFVGLISARTFVMYRDFEKFRRNHLLTSSSIINFADLGWEVLDGAQVETAAYVLARGVKNDNKLLGPFIRLLNVPVEAKEYSLLQSCNNTNKDRVYFVYRDHFFALPGSPLAYWASRSLVKLFSKSATFEPSLAYCGRGAATHAFFFRLAWEIPSAIPPVEKYKRLAHGGEYTPFFRENSVVINWENDGREVKEYINKQYPYLNGNYGWAIQDEDKYGQVGLTSGKRNERFNVQLMPAGHIFTHEGQGFIPYETKDVWFSLGYLNSSLVSYFLTLTSGLQKTWVYIRPIPVVDMDSENRSIIGKTAEESFRIKRKWSIGAEEASLFIRPWIFNDGIPVSLQMSIHKVSDVHSVDSIILNTNRQKLSEAVLNGIILSPEDIEEIAKDFERHPEEVAFSSWRGSSPSEFAQEHSQSLISYLIGIAFGRWDIRFATGENKLPDLPEPFASLPTCPPGLLKNAEGLPAKLHSVNENYPVRISWPGILVDDEGHPDDIVARMREAIEVIWDEKADDIEHEACEILGIRSLRENFRKPTGFFAKHLKRYSKNRRQAPIYWPLSTSQGSYTLWIYYHRLTDQTLHVALADYVDPKLKFVRTEITMLRETGNHRARLEELLDLEKELADFHDEIERIIKLSWNPNLNDGVLITACPLWKLFRLPKWQKDLKACWEKLEKGEFDWAHLAYSIWPKRVEETCKKDRPIAIAHGLEHLCQVEPPKIKAKRGKKMILDEDFE